MNASAPTPIRVLAAEAAAPSPADVVVRTHTGPLLEGAVVGVCVAGAVGWTVYIGALPWLAGGLVGGFFALAGGSAAVRWRRARRRDAWTLAIGPTELRIHLVPDVEKPSRGADRPVVVLPYTAIRSVRLLTRRFLRHPRDRRHPYHVSLEIRTRDADLAPLRHALAAAGGARVWVPADDLVRIHLAGILSTHPAPAKLVQRLGRYVAVDEPEEEIVSVLGARRLSPSEQLATLRALAEAGETAEAEHLASSLYGEDEPHARARIRRLSG